MSKIHFTSLSAFYRDVLEYIYVISKDVISDFFYIEEQKYKSFRHDKLESKGKVLIPGECELNIQYKGTIIKCSHMFMNDHMSNIMKLRKATGYSNSDVLFCKLTLENSDKDILINFVDDAREMVKERLKKTKTKSQETTRIYYYKEYWSLHNKVPKRPIDTLYLKEGQLEELVDNIGTFFSESEKEDYNNFGIPYKKVIFLHGTPGSGKTSTIHGLATYFESDIHCIPLSTDMDDSALVDAFSSINTEEDEDTPSKKIIVIEDIDCIFKERKEGDQLKNKLTLHGLLNCMDGFTCIEGALIVITANHPEALDDAMVRSCRIDYKIELGYADEYQTYQMYSRFLPGQLEYFEQFYRKIKHKKYTTAMLQELLFYNRKCISILDHVDKFQKIIESNASSSYDKTKEMNYM